MALAVAAELLLDTGPLVALLDASERRHDDCASILSAWRGAVVTSEAVVTEAAYLLSSAGGDGTLPIQFCLRGGATMKPWTDTRVDRAGDLMRKYRDVPMDYAGLKAATTVIVTARAHFVPTATISSHGPTKAPSRSNSASARPTSCHA